MTGNRLNLPLSLIGEEEKSLVFDDRPAQGRPELVALQVEPREIPSCLLK